MQDIQRTEDRHHVSESSQDITSALETLTEAQRRAGEQRLAAEAVLSEAHALEERLRGLVAAAEERRAQEADCEERARHSALRHERCRDERIAAENALQELRDAELRAQGEAAEALDALRAQRAARQDIDGELAGARHIAHAFATVNAPLLSNGATHAAEAARRMALRREADAARRSTSGR